MIHAERPAPMQAGQSDQEGQACPDGVRLYQELLVH